MTQKRSILYLDDEFILLHTFQEMFSDEYEVLTASTPAQAHYLLSEHGADIVISDQSMPGISGTEFLCEVAQQYPQCFRIMLTGKMLVSEAIPELSSGIVHLFATKPWREDVMRGVLQRASLHFDLRRTEDPRQ